MTRKELDRILKEASDFMATVPMSMRSPDVLAEFRRLGITPKAPKPRRKRSAHE